MLAHDEADPATVENPPARIRCTLSRQERRQKRMDPLRWHPLTEADVEGLADRENFEPQVIVQLDLERGQRDLQLPPDQCRAVEARFDGTNLQASETPEAFGWNAAHTECVRRSLEPDRRWGRRLRRRFGAYAPTRTSDE
jgi:hypothetical protein